MNRREATASLPAAAAMPALARAASARRRVVPNGLLRGTAISATARIMLRITLWIMGIAFVGLLLLIVLRFGATAPPTRVMEDETAKAGATGQADAGSPRPPG